MDGQIDIESLNKMIKRNPKQLSPTLAKIKKVKEKLDNVGIKFYNNKDWDNFQVYPMGDRRGEGSTYDTIGNSDEDLQDALNTGLDMAKRLGKGAPNFKRQNPKSKPKKKVKKVAKKATKKVKKTKRIVREKRPTYRRIAGENAAGGFGAGFGIGAGHAFGDWIFD